MGLFRRGPKERGQADAPVDVPQDELEVVEPGDDLEPGEDLGSGVRGPWDAEGTFPAMPRVDLGAIQLPSLEGMEVRLEVDKATNVVSAVAVLLDGSSLQLQAFAAPRSEGIWDEIRDEIAASITQQGGTVDDLPGPFGRELLARLPVRTPEGRTGHRPARFIGCDGPRWFLRGVLTGRAAVEPDAADTLENLFSQVVVVRGSDARPPRDLLPLQLPGGAVPPPPPPADPRLAPPERGPEITEIG